jgi:hypothetical protein
MERDAFGARISLRLSSLILTLIASAAQYKRRQTHLIISSAESKIDLRIPLRLN